MKKAIIGVLLAALIFSGCGGQSSNTAAVPTETPTPTAESTVEPTETPTETPTPEPKNPEDVLYDVVYQEDEMTGHREYWSEYNYYYYKDNVVFPIDYKQKDYSLSYFDLSLLESDGSLQYMLTLRYKGDDWIFFDHWMIKIDDEDPVEISLDNVKPHRDAKNGHVTERYSLHPGTDIQEVLKAIASCNSCKMRFYGEKSFTFDLTEEEIKSTRHIVEMYEDYIS